MIFQSIYDFSTLYTTLPHNLIKEKLLYLIERSFNKKEGKLYLACNDNKAFYTSEDHYKGYKKYLKKKDIRRGKTRRV